jgi:transcriptional regulator with XRE-family HTH domain
MLNMGFRENLKSELEFNNMAVKELSAISGVQKRAIDNYLKTVNAAIPAADAAVKIANALGVTVEFLIKGEEQQIPHEIRKITRNLHKISLRDRKLIEYLIESMIERKEDRQY